MNDQASFAATEDLEREALQRVVRFMRAEAAYLPDDSTVGALLDRAAAACLRGLPS